MVEGDIGPNEIWCGCEVTPQQESQGLLQVIYEDGNFHNQTTFKQIRERITKI